MTLFIVKAVACIRGYEQSLTNLHESVKMYFTECNYSLFLHRVFPYENFNTLLLKLLQVIFRELYGVYDNDGIVYYSHAKVIMLPIGCYLSGESVVLNAYTVITCIVMIF